MSPPHVALIGLPGVGKSTVGAKLAGRLVLDLVDLDDAIEVAAGASIPAIFETEGEAGFRDREERTLADLVDPDSPRRLVCCGGGVVIRAANRRRLRTRTRCVWLDADPDTLVDRLWPERSLRPLLAGADSREALAARLDRLRRQRSAEYDDVSVGRVDVSGRTPEEVVDAIVEVLG